MARARNIKPGFFRNADLVELPFEARLLFIGLWTIADRAGRLEDRPKQIKMELFPADSFDCDMMLNELQRIGMVDRYEHDGKKYLQVVNFCKHQNPHKDEKASTIPDKFGIVATIEQTPKKHSASTVQTPCKDDGNPADSLLLIPDSLNLIPEDISTDVDIVASKLTTVSNCPHQEILKLFANHLPNMPQPRIWKAKRAKDLADRWKWVLTAKRDDGTPYATDRESALDFFDRFFAYVAKSDFLTGRNGVWTGCDLPWLVKEDKFANIISGKYENRG